MQGATNVLQACAEAVGIKHVIMTSSAVVITTGTREILPIHQTMSILRSWIGLLRTFTGKNLKLMISNKRMISELGIQPRPVEESIIDVCYSLIDLGLVIKIDSWMSWTSVKETTGGQNNCAIGMGN